MANIELCEDFLTDLEDLLCEEPFDSKDFIERLSWRITGAQVDAENFKPEELYNAFGLVIDHLQGYYETLQKNCEQIEELCREEEENHLQKVQLLLEKNEDAMKTFHELDSRINSVATKVVHLGDQLESVNTPRARAVEAQKLMNHFAKFLDKSKQDDSWVLKDKDKLHEAADIILKLHLIAQELPTGRDTFDTACKEIAEKYDEIETSLLLSFNVAHQTNNRQKMKEDALILSHFKNYSQCIEIFIKESLKDAFSGPNIFDDIVPICSEAQILMTEVFSNPEQVMTKFIRHIFDTQLQKYIKSELSDRSNPERYLKRLFELYGRTLRLCSELSSFKMTADSMFLSKLTKKLFEPYLSTYISVETQYLNEKCSTTLKRYYEYMNHQKKQIQFGGIHDLRRDIQARLGNINIGVTPENYGGETFLSEEVALNLLQESKMAFQRCQVLSKQSDLPINATQIFDILLHFLCIEHIVYAVELGLLALPAPEPKSVPELYFFDIVRQCNSIIHLLEKQFIDSLVPVVISTPKHGECLTKKKAIMEQLEIKLHSGIERSTVSILGWIKFLLQSEQKKTDFKPIEMKEKIMATDACAKVVSFLNICVEKIRDSLDGKNVEAVFANLGSRLYRVIFEHLQQFQYSSEGAIVAVYDVNEYRKCVKEFKLLYLNNMFDTLHALCNLLVVGHESLKQVCNGDQLAGLDWADVMSFVQLRADYKSEKLGNLLKQRIKLFKNAN